MVDIGRTITEGLNGLTGGLIGGEGDEQSDPTGIDPTSTDPTIPTDTTTSSTEEEKKDPK